MLATRSDKFLYCFIHDVSLVTIILRITRVYYLFTQHFLISVNTGLATKRIVTNGSLQQEFCLTKTASAFGDVTQTANFQSILREYIAHGTCPCSYPTSFIPITAVTAGNPLSPFPCSSLQQTVQALSLVPAAAKRNCLQRFTKEPYPRYTVTAV